METTNTNNETPPDVRSECSGELARLLRRWAELAPDECAPVPNQGSMWSLYDPDACLEYVNAHVERSSAPGKVLLRVLAWARARDWMPRLEWGYPLGVPGPEAWEAQIIRSTTEAERAEAQDAAALDSLIRHHDRTGDDPTIAMLSAYLDAVGQAG